MKIAVKDLGTKDEKYYVVEDTYDFAGNGAFDATNTDSNALIILDDKGIKLVGSADNWMDWKCVRDQIKIHVENMGGTDYSTYATALTSSQRYIAAKYVPTKIVDNLGLTQLVTDSGSAAQADENISNYLDLSELARTRRYKALASYAYKRIGKSDNLLAEDVIRSNYLINKYVQRGVLKTSIDGVDGIEDYFQSTDSFTVNGMLARLNDLTYSLINDGSGQTKQQFVDACVSIFKNGIYPI